MRSKGMDILVKFRQDWQLRLWAQVLLLATGGAMLTWFLFTDLWYALLAFVLIGSLVAFLKKPWEIGLDRVSSYLDQNLDSLEYSSGLLLLPPEKLSGIARLQQEKTRLQLKSDIKKIKHKDGFLNAVILSAGLMLLGLVIHFTGITHGLQPDAGAPGNQKVIVFKPADSMLPDIPQPRLISQQAVIRYPGYTGIGVLTTSDMNIQALQGATVTWKLGFDCPVDSVSMESHGGGYGMKSSGGLYFLSTILQHSGFYNFRFKDSMGSSYVSDLYSIEVTTDQSPVITMDGLEPFISFDHDQEKRISFSAGISDDFGIGEAVIIATVSKGTGESVKFREEKLDFDNSFNVGSKNIQLRKQINLDHMNMEPGDELYFYIRATDLKTPTANISRSETYFVVIRDTMSTGFGMESTLGVDLMPDYFRSQRQLIIDTEKLISQRNSMPKTAFNATSNDLGFDQKSLRLRYGQFMGDESEGGNDGDTQIPQDDQDHAEDPLAGFIHDHDGNNEQNLVAHDHPEKQEEEKADPLAEFLHDHGDPESATLFTDNLRSKLRQTLDIMWDAELHLRLSDPEKSLPFQYRVLALLQEIKNSARIYVHRIGYDPPLIRDDVRLTGKIDEVSGFQKIEALEKEDPYQSIRRAISRLEQLAGDSESIGVADRQLFELAGNELALLAIESPSRYLNTLQQLKWLAEERQPTREELSGVQRDLLKALPPVPPQAGRRKNASGELNILLLQELERNEQ